MIDGSVQLSSSKLKSSGSSFKANFYSSVRFETKDKGSCKASPFGKLFKTSYSLTVIFMKTIKVQLVDIKHCLPLIVESMFGFFPLAPFFNVLFIVLPPSLYQSSAFISERSSASTIRTPLLLNFSASKSFFLSSPAFSFNF